MKKILTVLLSMIVYFAGAQSTTVVISQVYGGGSNAGATFNADFVELHNISSVTQDISGFKLMYGSATGNLGSMASNVFTFPAGTSISAGGYLMIAATPGTTGAALPVTPDFTFTLAMSGTNGKLAFGTSGMNNNATYASQPAGTVVDFVGYGTANEAEGTAVGATGATMAAIRNNNGCDETNNNAADFTLGTPNPRNSSSAVNICGFVPTTPSLNASSLMSFGSVCLGSSAGPNSFSISGTNLTSGNITIGPLSGYSFSTNISGTYTASLNINQSGGSLAATTIYVTFTPTAIQSYNGTIPVSGGGAASQNVTASGTGTGIVTPAFTQVAPVCNGSNFNLPTNSNNGVAGTWAPPINNTATTTYTFTPNNQTCASTTTMIVQVNQNVLPDFTQIAPVCSGTSFALPTTSNNGITGAWSPTPNNTNTTTYSFVPSAGQCAFNTTMTVEVLPSLPVVETGDSSSVGANSVTLAGKINYAGCTAVTEYGIEYSGINGFVNGFGIKVPSTNLSGTDFIANLSGLVQNTPYYYKAYAKNSNGIGYGEQKLFITKPIPSGLTIYSNPVPRGSAVHYSLSGIKPGHYALRVFNQVGQLVYQKDMLVQVNFIDDSFLLPNRLPIGLYNFEIFNPFFKIRKTLMVQ
jgi:hypothetical protein